MAVFTNRAILTYNGVETPSNTVTGEILGALSITKSSLAGSYSPGESSLLPSGCPIRAPFRWTISP